MPPPAPHFWGESPIFSPQKWGAGGAGILVSIIMLTTILIPQVRSKQTRLRRARGNFRKLYIARSRADYGDDSIFIANLTQELVKEAGQIVSLIQKLIMELSMCD